MPKSIVIVGAGHAAGQTAVSLRQGGFDGHLLIVGEEAFPPYQRPPLSKKFLAGELEVERLFLRPEKYYAEHEVDLRLGTRVTGIRREAREVVLDDGEAVNYDKLVLATGSVVRRLPIEGGELPGVHYLRSVADVRAIQRRFRPGARLTVMGAGYIGLEVAAVAIQAGLEVRVREVADRVMGRVVSPELSDFYARVHRDAGVQLELSVAPGSVILGSGEVQSVRSSSGKEWPADLVVIGVGVLPATELAEAAGLRCEDGIWVDEFCQTEDPHILAVGDCTNHPNALLGRRLRLESVHNAQEQAKTAAAALLGKPRPYEQVPWFWSDQYDLKLQIAGLAPQEGQRVLRHGTDSKSLAVFYLEAGCLRAVEAVNSAREFMLGKKLIAAEAEIDPAQLADPAVDFKQLAAAALD